MKTELNNNYGLGETNAFLNVYMNNRPNFSFVGDENALRPVAKGELHACGQACGNGWRKVFNVYAKLVFAAALDQCCVDSYNCWQNYRDDKLLQKDSDTALFFGLPKLSATLASINSLQHNAVHIVMGRTYAKTLDIMENLTWLDEEFAINNEQRVIVCPYFDYRQLSNMKIIRLVELIHGMHKGCTIKYK